MSRRASEALSQFANDVAARYSDFFNVIDDTNITEDGIRELIAIEQARFGKDAAHFADLSAVAVGYRLGLMVANRLGGAR